MYALIFEIEKGKKEILVTYRVNPIHLILLTSLAETSFPGREEDDCAVNESRRPISISYRPKLGE